MNNIKETRIARRMTPSDAALGLGISASAYKDLENQTQPLSAKWIEALTLFFGVDRKTITGAQSVLSDVKAREELSTSILCPLGLRFAILSLVAKLGGLKLSLSLGEDEIAAAIQAVRSYTEKHSGTADLDVSRLSQSLQITVLTMLQYHAVEPDPALPQRMKRCLPGALSLIQSYSSAEYSDCDLQD